MHNITCDQFEFIDHKKYVLLRNSACCRLTLLNARRGGEAARLLITGYEDGKKDKWIDKQRLFQLDELELELVKTTKVCYQMGKGNKKLVPLLIPNDTLSAVDLLTDLGICEGVGICKKNNFVFAPMNSCHKSVQNLM